MYESQALYFVGGLLSANAKDYCVCTMKVYSLTSVDLI